MKLIIIALSMFFSINNSFADNGFSDGFNKSMPETKSLAFMAVIPTGLIIHFYFDTLDNMNISSKIKYKISSQKISCNNLEDLKIDTISNNIYIGDEIEGYSNIQQVQNFDSKINLSKEKYLCINPKPNFMFNKGCLDYLKPNSIVKTKGIWQLILLFSYDDIIYAQFLNNQTKQTASTELFNLQNLNIDTIKKACPSINQIKSSTNN